MITYKFLAPGAVGLYSGFRWPTPSNGDPGAWVEVNGPLAIGENAIHAVALERLTDWIDDELWVVELDGEVVERDGLLLAARGRLVRRVPTWIAETAMAFAWDCVLSARDRAVETLRRLGPAEAGERLARASDEDLMEHAVVVLSSTTGFASTSVAFLADAIALFRGERPERYDAHPGGSLPATPGAIAANLGYVVAAAIGAATADERGPEAFDEGVAAERARQHAWLLERLGLPANAVA